MSKEVRPTAIIMNTPLTCFDTCFDEEDLLCPASQRITSKAWMQETPYPILPPVDALPTALPEAPEAKHSAYRIYQPLDPEEARLYAWSYQMVKKHMEEEGEKPSLSAFPLLGEWSYRAAFEYMAPPGVLDPRK